MFKDSYVARLAQITLELEEDVEAETTNWGRVSFLARELATLAEAGQGKDNMD